MIRFFKSRYFSNSYFLEVSVGVRLFFVWRSIIYGREFFQKGLKKSIGNGGDTRVWFDKWIDDSETGLRVFWIKCIIFDVNFMVRDLIDLTSRKWNESALQEVFVSSDVELIFLNLLSIFYEDFFIWRYNRSGNLTVKSVYWLARDQKIKECCSEVLEFLFLNFIKEEVWKIISFFKIKIFLWKVLSEVLSVSEFIIKRGL